MQNNQNSYPAKGWSTYPDGTSANAASEADIVPITDWVPGMEPAWTPIAGGMGFGCPECSKGPSGGGVGGSEAGGTNSTLVTVTGDGVAGSVSATTSGDGEDSCSDDEDGVAGSGSATAPGMCTLLFLNDRLYSHSLLMFFDYNSCRQSRHLRITATAVRYSHIEERQWQRRVETCEREEESERDHVLESYRLEPESHSDQSAELSNLLIYVVIPSSVIILHPYENSFLFLKKAVEFCFQGFLDHVDGYSCSRNSLLFGPASFLLALLISLLPSFLPSPHPTPTPTPIPPPKSIIPHTNKSKSRHKSPQNFL